MSLHDRQNHGPRRSSGRTKRLRTCRFPFDANKVRNDPRAGGDARPQDSFRLSMATRGMTQTQRQQSCQKEKKRGIGSGHRAPALGTAEQAECRQHNADDELHRVLRHAGKRALAPNVNTMNATSSPWSRTSWNARVNACRSPITPRRSPAVARASAGVAARIRDSSSDALLPVAHRIALRSN